MLINISGGPDMTLFEVHEAASGIQKAADEEANIIFGTVIHPRVKDEVKVTVVARGFDAATKGLLNARGEALSSPAPQRGQAPANAHRPFAPKDIAASTKSRRSLHRSAPKERSTIPRCFVEASTRRRLRRIRTDGVERFRQ